MTNLRASQIIHNLRSNLNPKLTKQKRSTQACRSSAATHSALTLAYHLKIFSKAPQTKRIRRKYFYNSSTTRTLHLLVEIIHSLYRIDLKGLAKQMTTCSRKALTRKRISSQRHNLRMASPRRQIQSDKRHSVFLP